MSAQPGYGPFDSDGRRRPPPNAPPPPKRPLPWLVLGGAVIVSALAVLLAVLRSPNVTGTATAASTSPTAASAASSAPSASAPAPGGARVTDRNRGGRARFDGSDRVALSWVQAMADGDFRTAYGLSCAAVRRSAISSAAGGDPAQTLGSSFLRTILGGHPITAGTLDSVIYSHDADSDIASFTLRLENGDDFLLLVYVQGDGTVCDFV